MNSGKGSGANRGLFLLSKLCKCLYVANSSNITGRVIRKVEECKIINVKC